MRKDFAMPRLNYKIFANQMIKITSIVSIKVIIWR